MAGAPINVTGPGNHASDDQTQNSINQLGQLQPNRGAVSGANGQFGPFPAQPQSSIGTIRAPQYQSQGAGGVTSYGLFSSGGGGGAPPPGALPPGVSAPHPQSPVIPRSPNMTAPGGNVLPHQPVLSNPPQPAGGGTMQGVIARAPQLIRGLTNHQTLPQIQGSTAAPSTGIPGSTTPGAAGPGAGSVVTGPTANIPMASGGPNLGGASGLAAGVQGASGGVKTAQSTDNNDLHSVDPSNATQNSNATPGAGTSTGGNTGGSGANNVAGALADAGANATQDAGGIAGAVAGGAGGAAGQTLSDFINGYNQGMGGTSQDTFGNEFNQLAPTFQDGSLSNAVGQNMQSMMDPAAWQQMADNRNAADQAANLHDLNTSQRRLADMQGRTGFANPGGVQGQMFSDYANRDIASGRQNFNDALNNQMNAIGQAGTFANAQRGQDIGRLNQLNAIAAQGASQNLANNRQDNPSAIAALQSLMGGAGQAAGGATQGIGSLLALLPLLGAA